MHVGILYKALLGIAGSPQSTGSEQSVDGAGLSDRSVGL